MLSNRFTKEKKPSQDMNHDNCIYLLAVTAQSTKSQIIINKAC